MKAAIQSRYGPPDVLQIAEVAKPVPNESEVLIRVRAASANPLDWRLMRGEPYIIRLAFGLRKPKITRPGVDLAGVVEAAGKNAKQFKPGDEVFGSARGAFGEYVCAREDRLVPKPANLSFEEAAAVPVAALTALQGLRDKGRIRPGHKVLVDGASGGVGTFAIQIAKSFGAEVTAVCSTGKMDAARAMGADHVIDYTREDFTRSGERYHLILAANAYHSILAYRRALGRSGICAMAGGGWSEILQAMLLGPALSLLGSRKMGFFLASVNSEDLLVLKGLLESGQVRPIIDRRYPLSEVAEAVRYLEAGHARGKVIITLEQGSGT